MKPNTYRANNEIPCVNSNNNNNEERKEKKKTKSLNDCMEMHTQKGVIRYSITH